MKSGEKPANGAEVAVEGPTFFTDEALQALAALLIDAAEADRDRDLCTEAEHDE
jgi:hypothetical protein